MKKWYGSLDNRLEEGRMFCNKIEVGTGVTEYFYSDRKPYEVTQVIDQKHIYIRAMDWKRLDKGISENQEYEYISNVDNPEIELMFRNNGWSKVVRFSKENWEKRALKDECFKSPQVAYNYYRAMAGLTPKQLQKIEEGKEVKKYLKMSISIGVMERYYDFSF